MKLKTLYSVNNIMAWIDRQPHKVIEDIDAALNNPEYDPHGIGPSYNLRGVSDELAYWTALNAFLIGLWGRVKYDTERTEKGRMAMRDFLEAAAQAARHNYESTSRVLTSYEILSKESQMNRSLR